MEQCGAKDAPQDQRHPTRSTAVSLGNKRSERETGASPCKGKAFVNLDQSL
jgi:hypothetical protein